MPNPPYWRWCGHAWGLYLPDLAEGLLGFYPDVALALEDVITKYLLLVREDMPVGCGLVSRNIHMYKVGRGGDRDRDSVPGNRSLKVR